MVSGSLHKGELGVALLACDVARPELAAMPFFGRIGLLQPTASQGLAVPRQRRGDVR